MPPGISTQHQQSDGEALGVGVAVAVAVAVGDGVGVNPPHAGNVGQTWIVQHCALSDIRLTKKQMLSPGLTLPMVVVTFVD